VAREEGLRVSLCGTHPPLWLGYFPSELSYSSRRSLLLERGPLVVIPAGRIILEAARSSFKCTGEVSRRVAADWFFLLLVVFSIDYQDCVFPSLCAAWEVGGAAVGDLCGWLHCTLLRSRLQCGGRCHITLQQQNNNQVDRFSSANPCGQFWAQFRMAV